MSLIILSLALGRSAELPGKVWGRMGMYTRPDGYHLPDPEHAETNKGSPECSSVTGLISYWINYVNGEVKIAPSFSKAWLLQAFTIPTQSLSLTGNTSRILNHLVPSGKCVFLIGGGGKDVQKFPHHYYAYTFNVIKCLPLRDPSRGIYICVSLSLQRKLYRIMSI